MDSHKNSPVGKLASTDQIESYIAPVLNAENVQLIDIKIGRDGSDHVIELCVDNDSIEGLSLDDIVDLSELLSAELDKHEMGTDPYLLQVTTPGLDRPLDRPLLWRRNRGYLVDITLADGTFLSGRIGTVTDENVVIVTAEPDKKGQPIKLKGIKLRPVAFTEVAKAVVHIEFSQPSQLDWEIAQDDERIKALLTQEGN